MITVGLTGGIGSGKSEVSRLLASYGAVVIDADHVAREVVEPGTPGLRAVVEEFGPEMLGSDGRLDRERLAGVVFADPERRAALNAIVHPLVRERLAARTAAAGPREVVVHDVPLLVEGGLHTAYDVVVVVDAREDTQIERLVRGRGMSESEARGRIGAQASREDRRAAADVVIDNDGSLSELEHRVRLLWDDLRARADRSP